MREPSRSPRKERAAEPASSRWLVVDPRGPDPATPLPKHVVAEHARVVHEALGVLSARPFHRVVVAARALAERPRAALRALKAASPDGGLSVAGGSPTGSVERAAL